MLAKKPIPGILLRRALWTLCLPVVMAGCESRPSDIEGRLVVTRHADRTFSMLNDRGVARADQLPAALRDVPIDAIYATPRQRNIDTATPIAQDRNLPIHTLDALGAGKEIFSKNPGKTVLWVGNQENLGLLWDELDIPGKPPVQFGEVYVVDLPKGRGDAKVQKRVYGTCAEVGGRPQIVALHAVKAKDQGADGEPATPATPAKATC